LIGIQIDGERSKRRGWGCHGWGDKGRGAVDGLPAITGEISASRRSDQLTQKQ
jgi:hypothetical protein